MRSDMTQFESRHELRTPLELTNDMDRALFFAKRGTRAIHDLRTGFLAAKAAYTRAFETRKVELKDESPKLSQADRESQARLDNWDLYAEMNEREAEFQYARDKLNDLQSELSKSQSEAKLVIKEMEMSSR